jgi:glycerate 2-kinase
VAAGKAATAMASAAVASLGSRIRHGLLVSAAAATVPGFESIAGGHPVPNPDSERAGRRALQMAEALDPADTLLILLSGGASALMAVPADGVTLDDKRVTTNRLLRAGADIHELNTVRKHLSSIKGGWLAARTKGACHTLAISDVVGDDLSVIASGPTVADASTFLDALDVVRRFGEASDYPAAVMARLERGAADAALETPKPRDPRLTRTTATIIGSRVEAMVGAAAEAKKRGYHVLRIDDAVVGEARTTAAAHVRAVLTQTAGSVRPLCVVSSGETTVHVTGDGTGGRNQEFALAAALSFWGTGLRASTDSMTPCGDTSPLLASVGTDGIDGPTDAAGAVVDASTLARASAAGLAPEAFLADNNAYAFFKALGDLIHTGPTGTNVGDLQVILLA